MIDTEALVFRLLARGLLDIRVASYEKQHEVAFALADLFHNIPYQMERARTAGDDCSDILAWIRMHAEQKDMSAWLDHALAEISN
jgi:hypothetical protein